MHPKYLEQCLAYGESESVSSCRYSIFVELITKKFKVDKYTLLLMLSHVCHVRLYDPMDCSPPGSSVHRIFQASILEWVAMPSSRGSLLLLFPFLYSSLPGVWPLKILFTVILEEFGGGVGWGAHSTFIKKITSYKFIKNF